MKVGILGTGDVGKAIGKGFIALGHEVKMGSREAKNEKALAFANEAGKLASAGTFEDAAKFGEVLVLATLGAANESALTMAGPANMKGKLVLDTTNPLDFTKGFPPKLATPGGVSGGEQVQKLLPDAQVVKAFNTVGNTHMFRPEFPGGPADMFICGNHDAAKEQAGKILKDFGWKSADIGGIQHSKYLEAMCMVWVLYGAKSNSWNHAFTLLRR